VVSRRTQDCVCERVRKGAGLDHRTAAAAVTHTPENHYDYGGPEWAPDGSRLAYVRITKTTRVVEAVIWSKARGEEPITAPRVFVLSSWSSDGKSLLTSMPDSESRHWRSGRCPRLEAMPQQRRASSSLATREPTCGKVGTRRTGVGFCLRRKKTNRSCISRPST